MSRLRETGEVRPADNENACWAVVEEEVEPGKWKRRSCRLQPAHDELVCSKKHSYLKDRAEDAWRGITGITKLP